MTAINLPTGAEALGAIAILVLAAQVLVLTCQRFTARRRIFELEDKLYVTTWAAIHIVNGTTPDDPEHDEELAELRFVAASEAARAELFPGQEFDDLNPVEQSRVRMGAHRRLVSAGYETEDDLHRARLNEAWT